MMENIGTQLTMAYEDQKNLAKRKTVLGPNLIFNLDGSCDPVPLHYLHPSLPNNPKSKPILRVFNIAVDETKSLRKLIMAHMPGQLWNHVGTAGKPGSSLKSGSNIDAAKFIGKKVAELALAKGIDKVVFDRSGYLYHGRIKALADAAREAGLKF